MSRHNLIPLGVMGGERNWKLVFKYIFSLFFIHRMLKNRTYEQRNKKDPTLTQICSFRISSMYSTLCYSSITTVIWTLISFNWNSFPVVSNSLSPIQISAPASLSACVPAEIFYLYNKQVICTLCTANCSDYLALWLLLQKGVFIKVPILNVSITKDRRVMKSN